MADILITVLGIICVVFVWVALYDSNRFVVRELKITDRRIRKPFRAVVVADLHNKRYGKENERLLAAIREQKPDMILVAGDIPTAKPGKKLLQEPRNIGVGAFHVTPSSSERPISRSPYSVEQPII